jgi:DNA-binding beta-propeller fold protein YncE
VEVPQDRIYFPVGVVLDKDAKHLFVVSSDFDLQYNGGAIQAYELGSLPGQMGGPEGIADKLLKRCTSDAECGSLGTCSTSGWCPCPNGERDDAEQLLYPGRCKPMALEPHDSVKIGAFATDAVIRTSPDSSNAERLFVPVRGDSTLHWIDLTEGKLECGQDAADGACDDRHRAGDDPAENVRGIKLNAEPFAIDADEGGNMIVVTNQTSGTASLFVNDWSTNGPRLAFALNSDRIPSRPVGVAAVPQPKAVGEGATSDAFMMTFRNSAQVRLFRFVPDLGLDGISDSRPYLVDNGGIAIDANSVGSDSRGIAIDDSARKSAEARCADDAACLGQAALVPLDVYVANRAPSSLLVGRTRPPEQYPFFFQSVPLTAGPSRVIVGKVKTPSGDEETRVFVACFDSRRIFVYDPQRARVETEILPGRGPHALTVDPKRFLLYVGHFTDSYIGVYSLDQASPATYGTMVGTLGNPKPPRSSK